MERILRVMYVLGEYLIFSNHRVIINVKVANMYEQ